MDASRLNLVVATAALQGMEYNSERLRQLFESSLISQKDTKEADQDNGYIEGPVRLSVDGSKVAKYNPTLNQFKCIYCGVTGNVQRLAEHYLASHVDSQSQIFQCPKCPYTSTWARCVRMHLNKQHGLTEIPPDLWATAHPLLAETTKLLNDLKTYVCLQSVAVGSVVGGLGAGALGSQLPLLPLPNRSQIGKATNSKQQQNTSTGTSLLKKRYTCERCAYSTDRRDLYNRHENIHKEDKPFHCYVCHKLFNRADHVKKHFLRIHKGRPYNVALIRRHSSNVGTNHVSAFGGIGSAGISIGEGSITAPLALALAQQAARAVQSGQGHHVVTSQTNQQRPNVSLSLNTSVALVPPKVVVPIGPITPASGTTPPKEASPPPPPVLRAQPIKRKADSSTSTSEVLVETPASPVVCSDEVNADLSMERHARKRQRRNASQSNRNDAKHVALGLAKLPPGVEVTVLPPPPRLTTKPPTEDSTVKTQSSATIDPSAAVQSKKRETSVLEPSQVKEYACELCSWRGVDGWGLRRHFNTHLKPFRCQFCDYRAARSERLGAHVLRVHGKHLCAKCDLSFVDAKALDNHVRTEHRSTNQYTRPRPSSSADSATGSIVSGGGSARSSTPPDDVSEGRFEVDGAFRSDVLSMVDDRDVDEGESIFHCQWCILSFADKLSLKYHLETKHSGAPVGGVAENSDVSPAFPYQCTICGFKCYTQGTIMEHMRLHSGQLAKCRSEEGGSRGAPCGFSTPFDSELASHVANLHGQGGGHISQCLHCGLAVDKAEQLMLHVKENHHIKPLECSVCRKAFLEYFPAFYGRICPSTAPASDQYTYMPQFLASNPSGFLEKLLTDVYKNLTEQKSLDAKTASIILSTIHKLKKTKSLARASKKHNNAKPAAQRFFKCSRCTSKVTLKTYGIKKLHVLLKHPIKLGRIGSKKSIAVRRKIDAKEKPVVNK